MGWSILGDSVAGTSHRARKTPCQDACRYRIIGPEGEWLVIAAADGAGSASHSDQAAVLVCDHLVASVEATDPLEFCNRDAITSLYARVRDTVIIKAAHLNIEPREMACTALLALVGPDSAAFGQLGDGAIVYRQELRYRVAFWPEPAEYANATDFLTDHAFADFIRFQTVTGPIDEVAVLTDGLQRLALDFATREPCPRFFGPLFNELRNATTMGSLADPFRLFLDSARVNQRTDDDKTLVIAVRTP